MTTTPRGPHTPLHSYLITWELTTRANFDLCGELLVRAASPARAMAKARERLGYRYCLPDAAIECPYCDELTRRA